MKELPIPKMALAILVTMIGVTGTLAQVDSQVEPLLGSPPEAPLNVLGLPNGAPHKLDVTPGFSVNRSSREQVRQFYNAVYIQLPREFPSTPPPIPRTALRGTNSVVFQNATLWRINWYRAMSGIPAAITFSASESAEDQAAALLISANNQLLHSGIPASWSCFSSSGTNAAENSNLAFGLTGPDAISGYIWDWTESQVGHRRWLLYPQTQVMATGDVPPQASYAAANATWIYDANYGGPRPVTPLPYVAWPPPGYVPYPVVYPQWSLTALSNART